MKNIDNLKKKIIYRSKHRGTKEMDLLLGNFVNKYIDSFSEIELEELMFLLNIDDDVLYKWYFNRDTKISVPLGNVAKKLKKFKF